MKAEVKINKDFYTVVAIDPPPTPNDGKDPDWLDELAAEHHFACVNATGSRENGLEFDFRSAEDAVAFAAQVNAQGDLLELTRKVNWSTDPTAPPQLELQQEGDWLFAIIEGKKIAKRKRGTKSWETLIPGWEVREQEDSSSFEVTFRGKGS